jgi:hypothetical protein
MAGWGFDVLGARMSSTINEVSKWNDHDGGWPEHGLELSVSTLFATEM